MGKVLRYKRRRRSGPRRPERRLRGILRFRFVALLAAAAGLFFLAERSRTPASPTATPPATAPAAVSTGFRLCGEGQYENCVIDGDTIRHGGERIRLADINAPEKHDPRCAREAALAERATHRLLALLNAGPVRIATAGDRDRDRYGRKLRVLERDGRSLGDMLIAEGLARRWSGGRRSWCRP